MTNPNTLIERLRKPHFIKDEDFVHIPERVHDMIYLFRKEREEAANALEQSLHPPEGARVEAVAKIIEDFVYGLDHSFMHGPDSKESDAKDLAAAITAYEASGVTEGLGPPSTKIEDWTRWIGKASDEDLRRELTRIYSANDDDIEGDIACKIMSYDWAHGDATDMGFESITEALEALAASTGGGSVPKEDLRKAEADLMALDPAPEDMRSVRKIDRKDAIAIIWRLRAALSANTGERGRIVEWLRQNFYDHVAVCIERGEHLHVSTLGDGK